MYNFPIASVISLALLSACSDKAVTSYNDTPVANIISHTSNSEELEGYEVIFQGLLATAITILPICG